MLPQMQLNQSPPILEITLELPKGCPRIESIDVAISTNFVTQPVMTTIPPPKSPIHKTLVSGSHVRVKVEPDVSHIEIIVPG